MSYSIVVTEHFLNQYIKRRGTESLKFLWDFLENTRELSLYGRKKKKIFPNDGYAIAVKIDGNKLVFATYLYDNYQIGKDKRIKVKYRLKEKVIFLRNLLKVTDGGDLERILFNY